MWSGGKMVIKMNDEEINDEVIEKAKEDVLNKWKSMGYDISYVKSLDIDKFIEKLNISDEQKKKLIREILKIGIQKDVILYVNNFTIKLINGIEIHNFANKSYYELMLLYKRVKSANLKMLFFTRKNHFWYWQ
jgi:hypothetical protein